MSHWFDTLTRTLAGESQPPSRRTVLRRLGAGLTGMVGAGLLRRTATAGVAMCDPRLGEVCGGVRLNCCPSGQVRNMTTCACQCPPGSTLCGGQCYPPCPSPLVRNISGTGTCTCECPQGSYLADDRRTCLSISNCGTGGTCNFYSTCLGNPGCLCFQTADSGGQCLTNLFCDQLQACDDSSDCPTDYYCAVNTCCPSFGVCMPVCGLDNGAGVQPTATGGRRTAGR